MLSASENGRLDGAASGAARRRAAARRQGQVLVLKTLGLSLAEIGRRLGVGQRTIWRDLAEIGTSEAELAEIIEDCGLDAGDIHIKLSQMADADLADIAENPDSPLSELRYKPLSKWPAIWRQGLAGKIRITPVAVPDGQRTAGGDPRAVKIEIERADILKVLELAAKLRAVDANVQPGEKLGESIEALASSIDTAIAEGRQRAARAMIPRDVTPPRE